eukprot:gene28545-33015_t
MRTRLFWGVAGAGAAAATAAFLSSAGSSPINLFAALRGVQGFSTAAVAAAAEGSGEAEGGGKKKKSRNMFAATGHIGAAADTAGAPVPPEGSYFELREDGTVDRLAKWEKGWAAGRTKFHKEAANEVLVDYAEKLLGGGGGGDGAGAAGGRGLQRVLVPLAGKTLDLEWLAARPEVRAVVGTEGVRQAFHDLQDAPGALRGFGPKPSKNPATRTRKAHPGGGKEPEEGLGNGMPALEPLDPMDPMMPLDPMEPLHGQFNWWGGDVADGTPVFLLEGDHFTLGPTHTGNKLFHAAWDRAAMVAIPPHSREEYVAVYERMLAPGAKVLLVTFDYDQSKAKGPPFC